MATIVTRSGKGSPLTWVEGDANFTNLNNDKLESSDVGSVVQAYSANLDEFAAVNPTTAGLALLDDSDAAAQRTTLGAVGITDTQTLTNKTLAATTNTIEARSGPGSSAFSFRNKIINGGFSINQRVYASGAAVGANLYGHDRWKMAASGDTYTFSTTNNKTTVTIPAGKVLQQVVEGLNLQTGTYVLSWEGTAQGKIGAGSLSASGVTGSITGGTNTTIEFGPGTVANVQLESGSVATPFESRLYGAELALCQRYCPVVYPNYTIGEATAGNAAYVAFTLPVQSRIAPTGYTLGAVIGSYQLTNSGLSGTNCNGSSFSQASTSSALLAFTLATGPLTAGNATYLSTSSSIIFTGCEL